MSKKDPAFLFYSKDWIEGTAEMKPEEKGIYIDLLCHQHQKGDLPISTDRLCRLVSMSEAEFLVLWEHIKDKFTLNDNNRLVNRKLTEVSTERLEHGRKNKITSALGVCVRKCNKPYDFIKKVKEGFKIDDFLTTPTELVTERVTEWFTNRLTLLEDEDAIGIEDEIINKIVIVDKVQEKSKEDMIVLEMMKIWMKHNPNYLEDNENDYSSCLQIGYKVAKLKKWKQQDILNVREKDMIASWEKIVLFIRSDNFLKRMALQNINNQFQMVVQKMNNPIEETVKQQQPYSQSNPTIKPVTDEMIDKYRKPIKNAANV